MAQQILSVTQINEYIRSMMDGDALLSGVVIRGEISNCKVYPSGHHYFTLKDDGGALKCVIFRSSAIRLKFRPKDGMQVLAIGKISVYPRDGAYQLYCTNLILDGVGDLYAAFEQLKTKLAAEGLFDPARKKKLPAYPQTIGIITSSAGAAVHDMLRILSKRYPLVKVRLLPVRVQGAEAPDEIAAAIDYANRFQLADLLIVGRGGGSIEDLWSFNDERVAYAIDRSEIPVISAVGHEPDVTISDFVADVRAATPSNAAEIAVPDQDALRQTLDSVAETMITALKHQLHAASQQFRILSTSQALQNPEFLLEQKRDALKFSSNQILAMQNQMIGHHKQHFLELAAKLDALSPLKVLTRGYAMVQSTDGDVIRSASQCAKGDSVAITLQDGAMTATITQVEENRT